MSVTGQEFEELIFIAGLHLIDDTLLGVDQRGQLGKQGAADCDKIALALQHAGKLGDVVLEPILLGVALGGVAQVADHGVDVVLEFGHFAAGDDLDGAGEVAFGDRGSDFGDGADLSGEIGGQKVDVVGEVFPGAGCARDVGLSAEAALDAYFARHRGDLFSEDGEGVGHVVNRVGQGGDFAFGLDGEFLIQIAVGDSGDDLDNAAHLIGEVGRHDVDRVGQVLPRSCHAGPLGLAAELAFSADLAGDAGDLGGKGVELVHHDVDGVLELEDFAFDVRGDFLGQIALGDGGGDFGNIADLGGQISGHDVDGVGQVLPGSGDAWDDGLAAQFAFGADFAGDAGDLGGEGAELIDHGVDALFELENFATNIDRDFLGEIAVGDSDCDIGDIADLRGEVGRH